MAVDPSAHSSRASLLAEIEACRTTYESTGNFIAVMEAITLAATADTFPEWLGEVVRTVFADEINHRVGIIGRWAIRHRRDVVDLVRSDLIEGARSHGATWDEAFEFTSEYLARTPASGGSAAMQKSWTRTHQREAGRYYTFGSHLNEFQPPPAEGAAMMARFIEHLKRVGRWIDTPVGPHPGAKGRRSARKIRGRRVPRGT